MKTELIDSILNGYAEIIRELLDSTDRLRFEQITRIAKLAHALHQQTSKRVGELKIGHEGGLVHYDRDPEGDYVLQGIGGIGGGLGRPMQTEDVVREVVSAFHPIIRIYMEREQETRLTKLFDLRTLMLEANQDVTVIDQRIAALTADMTKEAEHADPGVVHPEFLRRHQSGADGPEQLQGDHRESDDERARRARPASADCGEEGLVHCAEGAELEGADDAQRAHGEGSGRDQPCAQAGS